MPRRGHRHRLYRLSGHNLLVALRTAACRQQLGLCYWCGDQMFTDVEPIHPKFCTADHLIPRYAGGKTVAGNIVAACRACNNARNAPETKGARGGLYEKNCGRREVSMSR